MPSDGKLVILASSSLTLDCSGASGSTCEWTFGIFVDGTEIPHTDQSFSAGIGSTTANTAIFDGTVDVTAGPHVVTLKGGLSNGATGAAESGEGYSNTQLTALLAGS